MIDPQAVEKEYRSWAHKHAAENPGHRAKEGLYDPGSCDDCSERSPIYDLRTSPASNQPEETT